MVFVVAVIAAALIFLNRDGSFGQRSSEVDNSGGADPASASADEPAGDEPSSMADVAPDEAGTEAADNTLTTMTLVGGDVSVSYPEGFGLAVDPEQLQVSSSIPVCDEAFDYCIYLASDRYEGTNFDGAGLRIELRDDLEYEAACMLEQPDGYSGLEPVLEGASDHATARFEQVGQGAAGHFTDGAVLRLYFDGSCYELESRVAQARYANFEAGSVERFEQTDLEELQANIATIVSSVSLPDGRDSLWTRDDSSTTLVEDVQVRALEPAAGATVASPFQLSGEARGSWYFEGSFPYRLETRDGEVLASGAVQAEGDWMTAEFVPFTATIEFELRGETAGSLILMNDNPSGLPENDASFELPLTLRP